MLLLLLLLFVELAEFERRESWEDGGEEEEEGYCLRFFFSFPFLLFRRGIGPAVSAVAVLPTSFALPADRKARGCSKCQCSGGVGVRLTGCKEIDDDDDDGVPVVERNLLQCILRSRGCRGRACTCKEYMVCADSVSFAGKIYITIK